MRSSELEWLVVFNKSVAIAKKADRTAYDIRYRTTAEVNCQLDAVAAPVR